MKSITSLLAVLALGTTLALAADEKPATPAKPEAAPAPAKPDATKGDAAASPDAAKGEKPKRDPAEVFKKLDTNGDGKISLEEWNAGPLAKKDAAKAAAVFGRKDKDGDKSLTLEEFSAVGGKKNK